MFGGLRKSTVANPLFMGSVLPPPGDVHNMIHLLPSELLYGRLKSWSILNRYG
jgi:hypothetical protein